MNTTSQGNPFLNRLTAGQRDVLDAIRGRSIARFGFDAFRMEGDGDGGGDGAGDGSGDAAADADAAQKAADEKAAADKAAADDDAAKKAGEKVEDLPDWAQKLIKDTRAEAAQNRTGKTEAEKQQAKLLEGIATALGLKKGEEPPTVDELSRQLTEAKTSGQSATVELAVFKAAATAGADPIALTDSRSFMDKVSALDPAAKDFATKVKAEIETALKDNPKLKTGQASGSSSADHAGGSGDGGAPRKPKSMADAVASTLAGT